MKKKIKEICNKLNREQLSVYRATEELLILFSVSKQRAVVTKGTLCDGLCKVEATINAKEQCVRCGDIHKE